MNVSTWSIRNPTPSILLFVLLTLWGLISFKMLVIQQFPDIELPIITVSASLPGSSPIQLENDVAKKIENSIATIQGVKHIYSSLRNGLALISVEFRLEKSTQEALDDVRDAVSRIRSDLPQDLVDPVISKVNISGSPILTYTISSALMDDEALSWFVDNTIIRQLLSVRGVGAVARVGGLSREITVTLDPIRMLSYGVSAADITRQLRVLTQEVPGGQADVGSGEQYVRVLGTIESVAELAKLQITLAGGRQVRLDQIASIKDGTAKPRAAAFLNGKPVVSFEITRSRGAGEVEVANEVRAALDQLRLLHPDVMITEAFNFVDPVLENFHGSMILLLEGAVLAVLVVWFFLRDMRATLISAAALPLSIIPTFAAMQLANITINVVTLLALSLIVGVLVDDAIVEIENIIRHLRNGKSPRQAAIDAADEIGIAVIATSFTLIAVFLPTAFMKGVAGKFFVHFGWTAAIAVFFSLVVARMLTPMLAAQILRKPHLDHPPPAWVGVIEKWTLFCLRHRGLTVLVSLVFFVGSFSLVAKLPTGFVPADDHSQTQIYLSLPPGSTLEDTKRVAEHARTVAQNNPFVKLVYTAVGGGKAGADPFAPSSNEDVRRATLTINLTARKDRSGTSKQQIENDLRKAMESIPGAQFKVGLDSGGGKYILVLTGEDGVELAAHAERVASELRTIPGIGGVYSSSSLTRPELIIHPDFAKMADLGVSTIEIADTLRVATSGDFEQYLPKINLSDRQIPVVVKFSDEDRGDIGLLGNLMVQGSHGPVRITDVASLEMSGGPNEIGRYDRRRNINFEIALNQQPLGDIERAALALPSIKNLPPGIKQVSIGDAEAMSELFASFGLAMATGVLCIYIVLVLLFHDFVQPITILSALFLSIPGAFVALTVTYTALSMPSMIGLIMLMGIAAKNAILLIDYCVLARREHGLNRTEAILDACRKRARPIVMTTVAMGAGMLPIAIGLGTDPSFRAPMAIVVIGGLITSTFLSLLVVPVIYSLVDDLIIASKRKFIAK